MQTLNVVLKSIIFTEVSFIGSLVMFSYPWDLGTGFFIWGATIVAMIIMLWWFDEHPFEGSWMFVVALLNAIGVNFGGYLIIMFLLKIPIAGVTYVR